MDSIGTKQRTLTQNSALHLYFTQLADELNKSGLTISKTLTQPIEIQWNPTTVKELIWKRVQLAQLGKESTTELTTKEIDQVLDTITKYMGEQHGLTVDFPSIETLLNNQRTK